MAFIAYSVRDVPRATAFYRDTMGLKPGMAIGEHWVEFEVGGTTFGIGNGEPLGIIPGTSFAATFEVDDVAKERERLRGLGVPVTDVNDFPNCYSAFVTDPEGNRFGIHQMKKS
jgi:catechol 2,3-dioxygenase-like lactoylglutathione lyase family enzyme